jgi:TatD DNase family protein
MAASADGDLLAGPPVSDSHCHLADEAFAADLDLVVQRAGQAGVTSALCILAADDEAEVGRAEAIRAAWPALHFAAGVHPHAAGRYAGHAAEAARRAGAVASTLGARAIGEIGLDYHYDLAPRAVQRDVFAAQATLARARGLPVVIHTRDAFDDTLAVLAEVGAGLRGVLHCFTGTRDEARRALDLGLLISLSGILTFPRAQALRELAAFVPADRLLIETDAPYLAPVPYRGRRNEPAWVRRTASALADARGEEPPAVAARLQQTFAAFVGDPAAG